MPHAPRPLPPWSVVQLPDWSMSRATAVQCHQMTYSLIAHVMCQIVQKYFSISKARIFDSVWTWILVVQTAYNCFPYYIPDYFRVGRENPRTMKRFTSVKHSWFWTIKCEELTCAVAEALERDSVLVAHVPTVCLHQTWNWAAWPSFFSLIAEAV